MDGKYAEVESFKDGVAFVKLDSGRWVTINTKGDFVRSNYTYDDLRRERERENNKYKLTQMIDNTIGDINIYLDNMFDYLEKNKKEKNKKEQTAKFFLFIWLV